MIYTYLMFGWPSTFDLFACVVFVLCVAVGLYGYLRAEQSAFGWFLVSLVATPIVGLLLVLLQKKART